MTSAQVGRQITGSDDRYRALLAVSQAIVSHRDLAELFHELASRLQQVVRFDYLTLVLHEPATNTMRMHVLEAPELAAPAIVLPPEDDPAGFVWQTQQPLITSSVAELRRWPRLLERVQPYGVQSYCWLPLTTARQRLGTIVLTSKEPYAYDTADVGFLQHVANEVAVAVENALAFREIEAAFQEIKALKDQLAQENAYLEQEEPPRSTCDIDDRRAAGRHASPPDKLLRALTEQESMMNGPIQLLDIVALTVDLPDHGLVRGHVGTVVENLAPGVFEVEFCDDDGRAYALLALPADQLMVLHYRPLQVA
jgi:hypothetical protein